MIKTIVALATGLFLSIATPVAAKHFRGAAFMRPPPPPPTFNVGPGEVVQLALYLPPTTASCVISGVLAINFPEDHEREPIIHRFLLSSEDQIFQTFDEEILLDQHEQTRLIVPSVIDTKVEDYQGPGPCAIF